MAFLPRSDQVSVERLQMVFDNMSECYKIFWFKAIMDELSTGKHVIRFCDLIDDMIMDAWPFVIQYKLKLGPRDTLEKIVVELSKCGYTIGSMERKNAHEYIQSINDKSIDRSKIVLTQNVPFRFLAPFLNTEEINWESPFSTLAERINKYGNIPYEFVHIAGLNSILFVRNNWAQYFLEGMNEVHEWINENAIRYLEKRNPNVETQVSEIVRRAWNWN